MTTQEKTSILTLTQEAVTAIDELLQDRGLEGYGLRVFISGGGCSGYQYGMALENNALANDTISEIMGIKLFVDDVSLPFIEGATVDFVTNEMGTGFKIDNPNPLPASSCNCGTGEENAHAHAG
ncbi:MAG: iron-sulfur cluster assembly accessory protein, partial [Anaerolineales bacterium]